MRGLLCPANVYRIASHPFLGTLAPGFCPAKIFMAEAPCSCLDALQLQATLQAIRRYHFMGAGDWADALVSAYCAAGPSLEPHSPHACLSMLDTALKVA